MSTVRDRPPLPVVFGLSSPELTPGERTFFRNAPPLGFILFKRNILTPLQLRTLIHDLRDLVGRKDAPIFIDQEGGRVARLTAPHWPTFPPAKIFGDLAQNNLELACEAVRLNALAIAGMLYRADILVNCAPCSDLLFPITHNAIGDRAFSSAPEITAQLAATMAEGLLAGGVLPVIKHLPGHGRATVDSHHMLPIVDTPRGELARTDFAVFRQLKNWPLAMTAHVVYSDIDRTRPATLSPTVINGVIRGEIGFEGLLLSDDLSMKALHGRTEDVARQALQAGVDILLHCSGDMEEMLSIAGVLSPMAHETVRQWERAILRLPKTPEPATAEVMERLDLLLGFAALRPSAGGLA